MWKLRSREGDGAPMTPLSGSHKEMLLLEPQLLSQPRLPMPRPVLECTRRVPLEQPKLDTAYVPGASVTKDHKQWLQTKEIYSSSCGGQRPEIQVVSHAPSRCSFLVSSSPWQPLAISGWWEQLCTCAHVAFLPPHLCVSLCVFSPPLLRTPAIGIRADPNPIWLHLNWATSAKHVFPKGCSLRFWGNIHFGEALLNLERWK